LHTETLKRDWAKSIPKEEIVRKIYICYPTKAFLGREEIGFGIFDAVSKFFEIPYSSVHVVGSAKTGKSYLKLTDFTEASSDLDIGIISPDLFLKYMEVSYKVTKGYSDQTLFSINKYGTSNMYEFKKCLNQGYFRPDLMPGCIQKTDWRSFFNKLSNEHISLFKNINAGIYATQHFS
jgi:hypothetical protein